MELIYARWLAWSTRLGLLVLVGTFVLYASGLLEPLIELDRLPGLWTLPVDAFIAAADAPAGWGWLRLVHTGDYANLAGVALLGLVTLICYLRVLVYLVRRRERAFAVLAALQVLVLAAAVSGWLSVGH